MSNAPKWFNYVNAILDSIGTGEFNALQDKITWQVMAKVIPGLMSKKGIDNGLLSSFITNIQVRAGERDFAFTGPLVLTRNQKTHARSMGWDTVPALEDLRSKNGSKTRIGSGLEVTDADRDEANQHFIRILSALYPQVIRDVSAKMEPKHAENCDFLSGSKWNEMKVNHESDMTPAHAGMKDQLSAQDSMIQTPAHQGSLMNPEHVTESPHEPIDSPPIPEREEKKLGQSSSGPARQISLWVKETAGKMAISGNYEYEGVKYKLVFGNYDWTLAKLDMENVQNKDFRDFLNQNIYPAYRNANPGNDLRDRFHLSAIYATSDSKAYQDPAASEMAVALEWDANNQIIGMYHINGDEVIRSDVKKHNGNLYKATFR